MTSQPAILAALVLVTALILLCIVTSIVAHLWRVRRERLIAGLQAELASLPISIALAGENPPCPDTPLARGVARDILLETVALLAEEPRQRITAWLEAQGFVTDALHRMGSRTTWKRAEGARLLGSIGSRTAETALIAALGDTRYSVRDAAVTALGRVGGADAVAPIVTALGRRRVPEGRAMGALLDLDRAADGALVAAMDTDSAPVRAVVARALGLRRVGAAAPRLYAGLTDPDPGVRRQCATALAAIGPYAAPGGTRTRLMELSRDEF
ncbi:MAG: HEAT repeat domain-containing protein, partial [Actinomycetota bacterium]